MSHITTASYLRTFTYRVSLRGWLSSLGLFGPCPCQQQWSRFCLVSAYCSGNLAEPGVAFEAVF